MKKTVTHYIEINQYDDGSVSISVDKLVFSEKETSITSLDHKIDLMLRSFHATEITFNEKKPRSRDMKLKTYMNESLAGSP